MLIKCKECNNDISDRAPICPNCGFVLNQNIETQNYKKQSHKKQKNKRWRLPNGFGQISEIKNRNLRKPFRAMICVGKTDTGRPICKALKPITYFSTYNDAYQALVEYHKNPYELDSNITMNELYGKWAEEYFSKIEHRTSLGYRSAWEYCSEIYDVKVSDIHIRHIKGCLNYGSTVVAGEKRSANSSKKIKIKTLFNLLFDYAVEYEIVDRNIARSFELSDNIRAEASRVKKAHIAFTDDEMGLLWENLGIVSCVDMVLIQCYSGWRPQELCRIKISDIDITNWVFSGGMKTKAGKNRIVPIHSKIRDLVLKRYNEAVASGNQNLFFFSANASRIGRYSNERLYKRYLAEFNAIKTALGINDEHRPHDCRVQFVTMAKKYGVDDYAIKYIIGHEIKDLTERVYTRRTTDWLSSEIEKIK